MIALKLILEGLGLGFLLYLICAIGIRNGAVGMVYLYDQKVQERVVQLDLTTAEAIRKRSVSFLDSFSNTTSRRPKAVPATTALAITGKSSSGGS